MIMFSSSAPICRIPSNLFSMINNLNKNKNKKSLRLLSFLTINLILNTNKTSNISLISDRTFSIKYFHPYFNQKPKQQYNSSATAMQH